MNSVAYSFLKHSKTVLIFFCTAVLICLFLIPFVGTNFELSDYLPEDAPSTIALRTLKENFSGQMPNTSVYIEDVSITGAMEYKNSMAALAGVERVLWLDDVLDIYEPLEMADARTVEAWYKDGGALFSATVKDNGQAETVAALRELVGDRGAIAGEAVNRVDIQRTLAKEMPKIILFVVPLGFVILLISTSSWFEPVLFLVTIGVAVLINEGTNLLLGEISFITRATSAVLQLAISMDYAVFLLHSFANTREKEPDLRRAMAMAVTDSFTCIAASAATTVLGFLVLALMRFRIGLDMGIVLAKGVLISFLCVVGLLPVLALASTRLMDRTRHRPLLPSFDRLGRLAGRLSIPFVLAAVLLVVPSYLAQRSNQFIYGSSGMHSETSQVREQERRISDIFGQSVQMVLLLPAGNEAAEAALSEALSQVREVDSVISYANTVGVQVPSDYLPAQQAEQFRSGRYSRIILHVGTSDEGEDAFSTVETIRGLAFSYFGDTYHLVGQSVINYDLMDTITADNRTVTLAAIVAIGLVLLISFRSISIPILLLLTIESAIWLNLSIPYFTGDSLNYIGYQIISAVQLGATVDYGILFVQHYLRHRQSLSKRDALSKTVSGTAASILTPACILTIAGVMLGVISTNGIISQFGIILGRGAVISAAMVLLALPALLLLFDRLILATTWKPFGSHKEDL